MKITRNTRVMAADDDDLLGPAPDEAEDDTGLADTIDDISDAVDDLEDAVEDVEDDDPNIEINNNIDGKYIAECSRCHGIFISAMSESDQYVECITGTCPLCDHDTDQYLKWVIKAV